jgi:hypothetical protein
LLQKTESSVCRKEERYHFTKVLVWVTSCLGSEECRKGNELGKRVFCCEIESVKDEKENKEE